MNNRKAYGLIFSSICLLLLSLNPAQAAESSLNNAAEKYILKAAAAGLQKDAYWLKLLHYKKTKSLIGDRRFFLSPEGRRDPGAELEATIRAIFSTDTADDKHAQCTFPARTAWLRERLSIDGQELPQMSCKGYQEIRSRINPKKAVLAFPAAFMNKPASMFGHTFIRIDSDYRSKLLGHALNYAAFTGDSGGIMYSIKGVFGFFPGYYSVLPYYEKVKEYNDMEQRDIWEYELNLKESELERMVAHLWELKDIHSPYYFFDENCSSNILFLFEVARPGVSLTDKLGWWVIPMDTIRLVQDQGLVSGVKYRPSRATVINHMAANVSTERQKAAKGIAYGEQSLPGALGDATPQEKIVMLDIAAEVVQGLYAKEEISKDLYQRRFLQILNARSRLGQGSSGAEDIKQPDSPDSGHKSYRIGTAGGYKKGHAYTDVFFRPAYHSLIDRDTGYQEGSQIIMGDVTGRYYPHNGRFRLESFDLVNIISAAPRSVFFDPLSWKVATGIKREYLKDGYDHAFYYANLGYGVSYKSDVVGLAYLFAETEVNAGPALRDWYAFGGGGSVGLIKTITDFWKMHASFRAVYFPLGDRHGVYRASLEQNLSITSNLSITAAVSRVRSSGIYANEGRVGISIFF